jgi:ribA/ribD-fused uncharacterized protein
MISDFHGEHFFLSNFYPRSFSYRSPRFGLHGAQSGEHAYQAEKAETLEEFQRILGLATPGQTKRAGRSVQMRADWETVKYEVMWNVLWHKFQDSALMRRDLLETGDEILVEGNTWHDNVWGDCSCGRPACASKGENWLGEQLMLIRKMIREIS